MAKYLFEITEVVDDSNSILFKIAMWALFLWWVYLFYYLIYFMFVLPIKSLITGIDESNTIKIVISGCILLVYLISIIISSFR